MPLSPYDIDLRGRLQWKGNGKWFCVIQIMGRRVADGISLTPEGSNSSHFSRFNFNESQKYYICQIELYMNKLILHFYKKWYYTEFFFKTAILDIFNSPEIFLKSLKIAFE